MFTSILSWRDRLVIGFTASCMFPQPPPARFLLHQLSIFAFMQSSALYYTPEHAPRYDGDQHSPEPKLDGYSSALRSQSPRSARPVSHTRRKIIVSVIVLLLCCIIPVGHHILYKMLDGRSITSLSVDQLFVKGAGNALAFLAGASMVICIGEAWERIIWWSASTQSMSIQQLDAVFASMSSKKVWLKPGLLRKAIWAAILALVRLQTSTDSS